MRGDSAFLAHPSSASGEGSAGIDQIAGAEPTPEFAAAVTEGMCHLLGLLDDDLRRIALLKLEGHTNEEIAAVISRSVPTVERRLKLIRDVWRDKSR